jgi:hypothetical protein
VRRVVGLSRLVVSPAALDLAASTYRSPTARALARHAVRDPGGLARHLADPATSLPLLRAASRSLSLRDVAGLAWLFMPVRYTLLADLALWGARRLGGRDRADGSVPSGSVSPVGS